MTKPAVSIVMPIYNAGDFLKESLGGVLQQTLKNIEIIAVNDGSTDQSLSLMKEYAKNDSRVKIIDKPNGGYGHSMNAGIKMASGEYIGILEPDDFVDNEMFEELYKLAKENDADVVKSNYFEYSTKDHSNIFSEVLFEQKYDVVTNAEENAKIITMRPCIWTSIYRKSMLEENHILFNETPGASYQDTAFAFKVWVSAKRVYFTKNAYHHYRIDNDNSSVKSKGKIFSVCDEFYNMQTFINERQGKRTHFMKALQPLKIDTYTWNLDRIAPEYKELFKNQIAIDFIKADYEGFLDENYFYGDRWNLVQNFMNEYRSAQAHIEDLNKEVEQLRNSTSFRFGHAVMSIPSKIKNMFNRG